MNKSEKDWQTVITWRFHIVFPVDKIEDRTKATSWFKENIKKEDYMITTEETHVFFNIFLKNEEDINLFRLTFNLDLSWKIIDYQNNETSYRNQKDKNKFEPFY